MKKTITLAVATLLAAVVLVVAPTTTPTAHAADNRPCATKGELRQINEGWTRKRVQNKIDAPGKRYAWSSRWENREFRKCNGVRIGMLFVYKAGAWRLVCESGPRGHRCWWSQ